MNELLAMARSDGASLRVVGRLPKTPSFKARVLEYRRGGQLVFVHILWMRRREWATSYWAETDPKAWELIHIGPMLIAVKLSDSPDDE